MALIEQRTMKSIVREESVAMTCLAEASSPTLKMYLQAIMTVSR